MARTHAEEGQIATPRKGLKVATGVGHAVDFMEGVGKESDARRCEVVGGVRKSLVHGVGCHEKQVKASGAEARHHFGPPAARLKSCPDTGPAIILLSLVPRCEGLSEFVLSRVSKSRPRGTPIVLQIQGTKGTRIVGMSSALVFAKGQA